VKKMSFFKPHECRGQDDLVRIKLTNLETRESYLLACFHVHLCHTGMIPTVRQQAQNTTLSMGNYFLSWE